MNTKVYIHELIDVIGQHRARYMHHMTANWCPVAREERNQLCFGVWGSVGSTGRWPEVVNMWEVDGWDGLVADFEHELGHATLQDPSLAEWWAVAAELRRGGTDRILVPTERSRSIEELLDAGVRGALYLHELVSVPIGRAPELLDALHDEAVDPMRELGGALVGAFRVAMVNDSECVVLWALPDWSAWAKVERAWLAESGPLEKWRALTRELGADWRRWAMVDAPLSPMRIGRQPEVGDRVPLSEL